MNDLPPLFRLDGKTGLITGASGHLGRAIATGLAEAGANVVVTSRKLATAESLARELPTTGNQRHYGVQLDHLDPDSLEQGFQAALSAAGQIDVLINNGHEATSHDWTNVTAEAFNRQLQNATGYFLLSRMFRDHVVQRQVSGSVILLGSMYGVVGSYPEAYRDLGPASPVAYHALKGGVVHMTRHLAVYWAEDGVRVNCLSPGPFPGPAASPEMVERLKSRSPLKRMGRPEELKGPAVFLASDASSYMTGQNLIIDGGWTAW